MAILKSLKKRKEQKVKSIAILIDPDKFQGEESLKNLLKLCHKARVDFIFVGGSLLVNGSLEATISVINRYIRLPVIIFPGSNLHIANQADAILFLSLISGRNPDLLIGQHVAAAPILKRSKIEVLSTGYILVGNSANTTVAHISQTSPIPTEKAEIAVCTAIAGEMIGMKLIYLDAGSGSREEVPAEMIERVAGSTEIPLIVGGGIDTTSKAIAAFDAGADLIVLGTAIEKNANFVSEVAGIRDGFNSKHS